MFLFKEKLKQSKYIILYFNLKLLKLTVSMIMFLVGYNTRSELSSFFSNVFCVLFLKPSKCKQYVYKLFYNFTFSCIRLNCKTFFLIWKDKFSIFIKIQMTLVFTKWYDPRQFYISCFHIVAESPVTSIV